MTKSRLCFLFNGNKPKCGDVEYGKTCHHLRTLKIQKKRTRPTVFMFFISNFTQFFCTVVETVITIALQKNVAINA